MKHLTFLFGLVLSAQLSFAHSARPAWNLIAENPDRAACNMHSYEFKPIEDTPAPSGYIPVYISHYGRHGSRHDISSSTIDQAVSVLATADSLGQLTPEGKTLLSYTRAVARARTLISMIPIFSAISLRLKSCLLYGSRRTIPFTADEAIL